MLSPLIGLADEATPASHVIRLLQPGHRCGRSPDSVETGGEIGEFRAHDGRRIAKFGLLTLDQEIEGSNPPSPANLQLTLMHLAVARSCCSCDRAAERSLSARSHPGCMLRFVEPLPGRSFLGFGGRNTLVRVGQRSGSILAREGSGLVCCFTG